LSRSQSALVLILIGATWTGTAAAAPPIDGREGQVLPRTDQEDPEVPPEDDSGDGSVAQGSGTASAKVSVSGSGKKEAGDGRDDEASGSSDEDGLDVYSGGIEIGLRSGFGFPFGETDGISGVARSRGFGDAFVGQLPIWLDLGYRLSPRWMIGGYASYGFVFFKDGLDGCPSGSDCSASDLRFGAQAQFHIAPYAAVDPWVGAGLGYEIYSSSVTTGPSTFDNTLRGLEFLNVQAGLDLPTDAGSSLGIFAAYTLGQFSHSSVTSNGQSFSGSIDQVATHSWLFVGLRGTKVF
jgi:hypothetical protein